MIKIIFADDQCACLGLPIRLSLYKTMIHSSGTMNKGILCNVDFSESSKEALKWAVDLAVLLKTHLTILYTYRLVNSHNGEAVTMKRQIEENALRNFALLEKEFLVGNSITYEFKIEVGFVSNRIDDYARKNSISMMVIGSKMNSDNKESFDELAGSIHVPLVIVP
jgi:nucleotide-binding universal stress UspA family protein